MRFKIGIDVGGTFTDFLLVDEEGKHEVFKVLTTPPDPSIGVRHGIEEMANFENFLPQVYEREAE